MLADIANPGDAFEAYKIPLDEQIVAVMSPDTVANFLSGLGPFVPATESIKSVKGVLITMTLDPGELGVRLEFASSEKAQSAKDELSTLFAALALAPIGPTADPAVRKALKAAEVSSKGSAVTLTVPIAESAIAEACEQIGNEIRKRNKK
jgi:hypothetical protein